MKNKLPVMLFSLLLIGCHSSVVLPIVSTPTTSENTTAKPTSQVSSTSKPSSIYSIYNSLPEEEVLDYSARELKTQVMIGEMMNSLASQSSGGKSKHLSLKKVTEDEEKLEETEDEEKSEEIEEVEELESSVSDFTIHETEGNQPEVKSLTEPLSEAFGMMEYYIQHNKTDISVLDTTFYESYERAILDEENGGILGKETCYKSYLTVRDFPRSQYKMIYIRYWSRYNYIVLVDDEGRFATICEYVSDPEILRKEFDGEDLPYAYSDTRKTSLTIQADGYVTHCSINTKDYDSDVEVVKEKFNKLCEEYNLPISKLLLDSYYDLYKSEDGSYDMTRLTQINEDIDLDNPVFYNLDNIKSNNQSYLYFESLSEAFMNKNYSYVSRPQNASKERLFEYEGEVITKYKGWSPLIEIPEDITSIEGLFKVEGEEYEESEFQNGFGLVLHENVENLSSFAFEKDSYRYVSHVFVDMLKDECSFVDVLENSGANIYYKDEFMVISGIYVPSEPHQNKEGEGKEEIPSEEENEEVNDGEELEN